MHSCACVCVSVCVLVGTCICVSVHVCVSLFTFLCVCVRVRAACAVSAMLSEVACCGDVGEMEFDVALCQEELTDRALQLTHLLPAGYIPVRHTHMCMHTHTCKHTRSVTLGV